MQLRPIASALLIATLISVSLPGCGRFSNATPEELIQRAKDKQAKGDISGGIIELKNAVQKDPNNAQARFLLGTLYVHAKQGNAAEKELTKARDLGYDQEALKLPLGEALLLVRDYKRLLEEIQPAEKTSAINKAKIWVLQDRKSVV